MKHYCGIKSIFLNMEIKIAYKPFGQSPAKHMKIYNSTYEEIDEIKGVKKL